MNTQKWIMTCAALLMMCGATATGAQAQSRGSIEQMSDAGRRGTAIVGRGVGNRMCGYRCGRAMGRATERVYDGSRDFATRNGPVLQDWGRRHVAPRLKRGR